MSHRVVDSSASLRGPVVALIALIPLLSSAMVALGQDLAFQAVELRGRIDNLTPGNVWQVGDQNGNGALDDGEPYGPVVMFDAPAVAPAVFSYKPPIHWLGGYVEGGFLTLADYGVGINAKGFGSDLPSRSFVQTTSLQLMQVVRLDAPEAPDAAAADSLELGYGARFFSLSDQYSFDLQVDSLRGGANFNSIVTNDLSGPQIGLKWTRRRGRWRAAMECSVMYGYCTIEGDQHGRTSGGFLPGDFNLNRPAFMNSIGNAHLLETSDYLPLAEFGFRAMYDVSPAASLFVGYDALHLGSARLAQQSMTWNLPDMGLSDRGGSDVTFGVASMGIEWRR